MKFELLKRTHNPHQREYRVYRRYLRMLLLVSETIRLMAEIDCVIDEHGGWPGAFVTEPDECYGNALVVSSLILRRKSKLNGKQPSIVIHCQTLAADLLPQLP